MIIEKTQIKGESAYSGVDFLETLEAELSLQKDEFEQDKSVMQDRIKETESLFLEAGKNNKTLLEKEEKYKQVIDTLDEKNRGFIADIEEYKKQIANLEEALKQTSFKAATETETAHTRIFLPLNGNGLAPVVEIDQNGTMLVNWWQKK